MTKSANGTERFSAILVIASTAAVIFINVYAATGRLFGVDTGAVSDAYPTMVTPAGYAFSIWSLIYLGLIGFSIYQILPANLERFRPIRSLCIVSCAVNIAWLLFWHSERIGVCVLLLFTLAVVLAGINLRLKTTTSFAEYWLAKAPFNIYFGWVTVASFVNLSVALKFFGVDISQGTEVALGIALIALAAVLAIVMRMWMRADLYPLAVAWALAAVGVKQSGNTPIVIAAAFGTIVCLITTLSLVVNLPSSDTRSPSAE